MIEPLLTAAARRHIGTLLGTILPHADRLDRRFRSSLRSEGRDPFQIRALLAITPAAAARVRPLSRFVEQVEYNGRRLAKLNVPLDDAKVALRLFGTLLDGDFAGQFEPAREQLYLATVLALNQAYYQVRESEAQALFGVYRAEAEAHDMDDLLKRLVRILTHSVGARKGRLFLLDQPAEGKKITQALYIERGQPEEKLVADAEMRGKFASYWSFPIIPVALLQFGFAVPYPWLPREMTLLHAVGQRCREAIQRAQLQAEVRRLQAQAWQAEAEERRRLGRELHDEAGQSLLALRLQLEMMERQATPTLLPMLVDARGVVERTVDELRRIVAALSPAVLERLGLEAAIRQLVVRFRKTHAAETRLRLSGKSTELPRQAQEVIYRVAQESLHNIAKHSQATRVNLLLHSTDKSVRLSVSDNGAGFRQEEAAAKPMSFGLTGMRERAELLQGNLNICSTPGKGVRILLQLPVAPKEGIYGKDSRIAD